jgi:gas vesicle protein GvpL/GvpF
VKDAASYLYCLVRGRRSPDLRRAPRGLPGAGPVRALDVGGGLWLIVADVPLSRYGTAPIERRLGDLTWVSRCAASHEAVVEHFRKADALLPMKLFTLFRGDDRAVASIRDDRASLERALDHVAGREEWGVRVVLDEEPPRVRAAVRARTRPDRSGAGFLRRKLEERTARSRQLLDAKHTAAAAFDQLARRAADGKCRAASPPEAPGLLLDAVFLVPSRRVATFKTTASRVANRLAREGCRTTLSGPWPPYHFAAVSE